MNQFDNWREAWRSYLLGSDWDAISTDSKAIITSLERIADAKEVDPDPSIAYSTLFDLRALAMAYCTSGTKYHGRDEVKEKICSGLLKVQEEEYNLNTAPDKIENWWLAQIGNPLRLLDILILMYDELPNREMCIKKWTDIILHYQGAYAISSRGQEETGANLIWKCHVLLLTGILREDMALIDWVNAKLPTILQYSNMKEMHGQTFYDDGFYPDGSFIQHYFFAYTGGYGRHLLNILSGLLYAFKREACLALSDEKKEFFCEMIHQTYEPLIYKGRFMDLARGREISRYYHQDHITGRHIMRGLCYLSSVMEGEVQKRVRAMIKEWLSDPETRQSFFCDENPRAEYFVQPSLAEVLREIEMDEASPRGALIGNYQFGVMSKVVHLRKHFGLGISMHSPTISSYECVSHEGARSWHISDGMTYLYTTDIDAYNHDYYGCVDMQRLAGTTVDRSPNRQTDLYYTWYLPESKNPYAFAGGVTLGKFGITGLQYRGQGNGKERDLEVKKSWFMFDDEVVCLGSGITSTTGNPIETIVDNRKLLEDMSNVVTFGDKMGQLCAEMIDKEWVEADYLHLTGNVGVGSDVGYYFPKGEQVHVLCEKRTGDWENLDGHPEHACENAFVTIWIDHGAYAKNADYAYVLLPGNTVDQTRQYSENPGVEIVACCEAVHAVRHPSLGLLGINFWNQEVHTCEGLTCDTQASVMVQIQDDNLELAISDPTKTDAVINLTFDFSVKHIQEKSEQIEIIHYQPLAIRVNTTGLHGKSVHLFAEMVDMMEE